MTGPSLVKLSNKYHLNVTLNCKLLTSECARKWETTLAIYGSCTHGWIKIILQFLIGLTQKIIGQLQYVIYAQQNAI